MGNVLSEEIKDLMGLAPAEPSSEEAAPVEVASAGEESTGGEPTESKQAEAAAELETKEGAKEAVVPAEETPAEPSTDPAIEATPIVVEAPAEEPWKAREALLLAEIERLSKMPQTPPKTEVVAPPKTVLVESATPQREVASLFNDEELQEAFGYEVNLEKVRNILRSVHSVAVEDALRIMPSAAAPVIKEELKLQKMVDEFYVRNPDFEGLKSFVGLVCTELESKNPDWVPLKVLEETEKEVRNRLQKPKAPAQSNVVRAPERKPALPGGGAKVPSAPQLSGVSKEIRELM